MRTRLLQFILAASCVLSAGTSYAQTISTVAGFGITGFTGDGVQATATGLDKPWAVAVDAAGNLYIADRNDQRIRKVTPLGVISTVAGNGTFGYSGDGSNATLAQLFDPSAIALDAAGNLFIADYSNHRIRKVTAGGIISTVAGNGTPGAGIDGIAATNSQLNDPKGVAVDAAGNIYIADYGNTRVRKVNTAGIISTVAGDGTFGHGGDGGPATNAQLFFPNSVAVDGAGNLYIADENSQRIRKVNTAGIITNYAGDGFAGFLGDGTPAIGAEVNTPTGVVVDAAGNVYFADMFNQRIRKINAAGIISTIAGNGTTGFFGDGGPATAAFLSQPSGVTVDVTGNVYIADQFNDRIRKINTVPPITGGTGLCIGGTSALSDALGGGTWTSSNTSVATVGLGSGLVSGLSAGTSIITYKVTAGSVFTTVTVSPLPSAGTITGPGSICVGTPANFSDLVSGGVWSSSNTSVATVSVSGLVIPLSAGTVTLTYSVSNSCGAAFATKPVSVGVLSAGTITGASTVCTGFSVFLSDAVAGGVWSATNTHALVSGTMVTGLSNGVDTILYTVTGACGSAVASHAVTVNSFPAASPILGPTTVCIGTPVILSDATPAGVWNNSNIHSVISAGGVVTGVTPGTDVITYTVTNFCGSSSATATITIGSLSAGAISGTAGICVGSSSIFGESVTGGIWGTTNSNAFVTTGGMVIGLTAGLDTVIYSVTGACGSATASATVAIVNFPAPAAVTGPAGVCIGSFIVLSDAVTGGAWSTTNTHAVISSGGVVTPVTSGIDTIIYTLSNACGSAAVSKVITIDPLPIPGTITGLGSVCVGASTPWIESVSGGIWTVKNPDAFVTGSGLVIGLVAGVDTVSYTVTNACGSVAATKTVTVNPAPNAGAISGAASVCTGASILLSDGAPGGVWSTSNTKATISAGGLLTGVATGVDTVYYTVTGACGTAKAQRVVTINTLPSGGTITGITGICIGLSVTLSDGVPGGVWSASNTNVLVSVSGIVTGMTAGTDVITYTVSNGCGSAFALKTVTISPTPTVGIITAATANLCVGTTIKVTDAVTGGVWSSSDSFIAKVNSTGTVTGMALGTATISYTVTGSGGCSNSATFVVTMGSVFPTAVALPAGSAALCNNAPVVVYVVTSGGTLNYQWLKNNVAIPGATQVSYTATTAGSYSVILSDAVCSVTYPGTTVLPKLTAAISFTPPNTLSTGSFTTYEWYLNGHFIPGATTSSIKATASGAYTVMVLDANLCHDTSAAYNYIAISGVNELLLADQVKIYPNPASSVLTVDAPVNVHISVLGMDGRVLLTHQGGKMDIGSLANGLYMLMIYDDNNMLIKATKFVKTAE